MLIAIAYNNIQLKKKLVTKPLVFEYVLIVRRLYNE
jgi:hypothetical protein